MLQIDTLTKKIELLKQDIQKKTKDIESTKKELKTRQAVTSSLFRISI